MALEECVTVLYQQTQAVGIEPALAVRRALGAAVGERESRRLERLAELVSHLDPLALTR